MDKDKEGSANTSTAQTSESQSIEQAREDDPPQPPSPNALKVAATECLNSWIYYLQMLNSLCTAGLRLSQSLATLAQPPNNPLAIQCTASWDELTKSTVVASHAVKTHIAAAMQDLCIGETFTESDALRQQEHNQQIITENILTFVNLQYQFSIAGCECLGAMAMCPQCQTIAGGIHDPECHMASLQQCFARLYTHDTRSQTSSPHPPTSLLDSPKEIPPIKSPMSGYHQHHHEGATTPSSSGGGRGGFSPYGVPETTLSQQQQPRGSSPVYAYMAAPSLIETMRGPLPNPGQLHTMKGPFPGGSGMGRTASRSPLHFPLFPLTGQRRWSEAAAVVGEIGASEGAAGAEGTMRRWSMPWDCGRPEAITASSPWHQRYLPSKLAVPSASQDRSRSTTPEAVPPAIPGTITSGEGLAEAIQLLSCRPMRCAIPHQGQSLQNAPFGPPPWAETHEERILRRFPGHMQRGNWQSMDAPHTSGMSVTEHFDIFPAGIPLTSRKSSSSTDSSSCLSIHSRSTASGSDRGGSDTSSAGDAIRMTNLYSMWSGNEHLPFIRLPESQEPQEDSDAEDTPTDQSCKSIFPKPS